MGSQGKVNCCTTTESNILEETSPTDQHHITVSERRIAITYAVAAAWLWLHQYKQDTIISVLDAFGKIDIDVSFRTLKLGHGNLSLTQSQMMNLYILQNVKVCNPVYNQTYN